MKKFSIGIIYALAIAVLSGCTYVQIDKASISGKFDKAKFRRIGVLVVRMGMPDKPVIEPIGVETDYSLRESKYCYKALEAGKRTYVNNFYLDDDSRLRESVRCYPYYRPAYKYLDITNRDIGMILKYSKNISPELYAGVADALSKNGYQVVNIKDLGRGWGKPISEMKIGNIIEKSRGTIDALLVMHYIDIGRRKGQVLSGITYEVALFSVSTKEKLISYTHDGWDYPDLSSIVLGDRGGNCIIDKKEYADLYDATYTLIGNEIIQTNPQPEQKIIQHLVRYVKCGIKIQVSNDSIYEWKGIDAFMSKNIPAAK